MGLYNQFKTSPKLEKEGVWREFEGFRVLLARAGGSNQAYNSMLETFAKDNKRAIATDMLSEAKSRKFLASVFAKTIVLDWQTKTEESNTGEEIWVSGIESPDGDDLLPVNPDNIAATLEALPDLFMEIREVATGQQFYRASLVEHITKN